MINNIKDSATLNNGVKMPWLGLGVWQANEGEEVEYAVKTALNIGYRSIDTAAAYGNEVGVGKAIKQSSVPREEIFVTTKVANGDQGFESTLKAFETSQKKLDLDYIDLYLIHWPKPESMETWRALEKLYKDGVVKSIGVSNFMIPDLEETMKVGEIKPMVNQCPYHPLKTQKQLLAYCQEQNIQFEAYSPIKHIFDNPVILELTKKYGKSAAQIVLRWDLQTEVVTIPKSVNESRLKENVDIFDFELTAEDVQLINAIN